MAQPAPIEHFGKYQILERIARGGMAEIYKARMEGIGGFNRLFAIKRILPSLSENREYIDLLVDEAKIAGLLSHANIVQILDLGQVNGQYYVAMEYVHGQDLGNVLARCRERGITLPVPHSVFILIEVLKGLEYAHNRQINKNGEQLNLDIIHRDVTPSNVLVSFQGEIKLTDFGIAKAKVKAMETVSGVIKGKFDYMAPEQANAEEIDQRTDIFAAGVLLYEMLCGVHPFRKRGDVQTIEAIRAGRYAPPTEVNPDVPYSLQVILDQALAKNRDQRYPNATAFKEALTRFFHDAGFIFSHSTLAAFLKGLFPQQQRGRRRANNVVALKDQDTRPLSLKDMDDSGVDIVDMPSVAFGPVDTIELEQETLDTSGVTSKLTPNIAALAELDTAERAVNLDEASIELSLDTASESGERPPPGPIEEEEDDADTDFHASLEPVKAPNVNDGLDEETLLRNAPVLPVTNEWDEDIETVIRSVSSLKELNQIGPRGDESEALEELSLDEDTRPAIEKIRREAREQATREMNKPQVKVKAPPPRPRPPIQHIPQPKRRKEANKPTRRTRQFVLLVGTLCLAVGFAFGAILGSLAQELKSPDTPVEAVVQKKQPTLLIDVPKGAVLEVDGRAVPLQREGATTVRVSAGQTSNIKVSVDGFEPLETTTTLNHNEQLLLVVDLETLKEK